MREKLRRVLELARKERRQMFRDPRMKPMIFIAPIIQLLLFGYAVNTDVHDAALFVVDRDATRESRSLVDALTAGGYFRVVGRSDRSADLVRALDSGRAVIAIEIPPDFTEDLRSGAGARVQIIVDGTNSNTATIVQGYANRIVRRWAVDYGPAQPALSGGIELRDRAWFNPGLSSRVYNVPAVIGTIVMLMCLLLTSLAVVREREVGTLEQLLVSPLSSGELMLGKTLPVLGIALFDLVLISAVALLWFHVPFRGSVLDLLLAAFLYALSGLSIGLFISTISKTQQEAFMTMFLLFFPLIVLSGFLLPVGTMPRFFQILTLANPLRHFIDIVRAIFIKGAGLATLWPSYAALAGLAALTLLIATRRFHRTLT
jgi:ABC-2 type transport system permease protein